MFHFHFSINHQIKIKAKLNAINAIVRAILLYVQSASVTYHNHHSSMQMRLRRPQAQP
jgi:hypothetical protein